MDDTRRRLAHLTLAFASAAALAAAPQWAQATEGCDGPCPSPSPQPPPPPPPVPQGTSLYGNFFAYPGTTVQGGINNGSVFTFGGGAGTPYTWGQTLNYGNANSNVQLQSTLAPTASVLASASQSSNVGRSSAGTTLSYRVVLVANSQAAYDHISSLLSISGAIANVSGSYSLTGSNYGYGSMSASTGAEGLDASLGGSTYATCGSYGIVTDASTAGCGTGSFNMPVNFMAGSYYADAASLSFVSMVGLSANANAGIAGCCDGGYAGTFSAFVDPTITLAEGIDATLFLGDNNNVGNPPLPVNTVPEPETWTLMLTGLGIAAWATRRQRQRQRR